MSKSSMRKLYLRTEFILNFSLFLTVLRAEWTCQKRTSRLNVESFRPLMQCNPCSFSNVMLKSLKSCPSKKPWTLNVDFCSSLHCFTYFITSLFPETSMFVALCTVLLTPSLFSHNLVSFFFLFFILSL